MCLAAVRCQKGLMRENCSSDTSKVSGSAAIPRLISASSSGVGSMNLVMVVSIGYFVHFASAGYVVQR